MDTLSKEQKQFLAPLGFGWGSKKIVVFPLKINFILGCLGGSVGGVSNFSSGHDLAVCEFKPRIGLCADSLEPGAYFGFCVSPSLGPSPAHALSLNNK